YLQDSWQINDNLVLNAGLRYSSFENTATTGESYVELDDQLAPRVQLIWDPSGNGDSKLFATFGRYFQPVSANMNIKMASGQRDVHNYYLPAQLNSDGSLVLGTDGAPSHGALVATDVIQSGAVDVERIAADNLGPMYSDEFTLGYESQFSDRLKGGVRFVYRNLKQSIEDSDLGPVVAQWLEQNNITNNANEYYFYTL